VNLATISVSRVISLSVGHLGDKAAAIKHEETAEQYCEMLHTGHHTICFTVYIFMAFKSKGVANQQEDLTVPIAVNIFQRLSSYYPLQYLIVLTDTNSQFH
jgi:hypothetical protein